MRNEELGVRNLYLKDACLFNFYLIYLHQHGRYKFKYRTYIQLL